MKFPFVTRAKYDAIKAAFEQEAMEVARLYRRLKAEREFNNVISAELAEIKAKQHRKRDTKGRFTK